MIGVLYWPMVKTRRGFRERASAGFDALPASAGDRKKCCGATAKLPSLAGRRFLDKDGSVMNPADYDHYMVVGDSMRYCGIKDGDMILVTKGANIDDLAGMPVPVVLRWADPKPGEPLYKLRRAWATWIPSGDPDEMLRGVFFNPKFSQIREIAEYDGDEALVKDFKEKRLPRYLGRYGDGRTGGGSVADVAIVSTTFHVDEGKIRLSIHPLSSLTGVVKGSFDIGG